MPTFRATFCDPFNPEIVQLGEIPANSVIDVFEKIPWMDYLAQTEARPDEVQYSPSFELENTETRAGVCVSILEPLDNPEWYIFFKRPKMVKTFFGLSEKMNNDYMTEVHGQTQADVVACLNALIKGDMEFLEEKVK